MSKIEEIEELYADSYKVKLENFEGPLQLLLHLIKEAKLDIEEVALAQITEQYLDYIRKMLPNISSEIVEMQKTLQPGTCVAFGKAFKVPIIIRMDLPDPEPTSSNCDVLNRWT